MRKKILITCLCSSAISLAVLSTSAITYAIYEKNVIIQYDLKEGGQKDVTLTSDGLREYVYDAVTTIYLQLSNDERNVANSGQTFQMVLKNGNTTNTYDGTLSTDINGVTTYSFTGFVNTAKTIHFKRMNSNKTTQRNISAEISLDYKKDLYSIGERITEQSGYQYYNLDAGNKAS